MARHYYVNDIVSHELNGNTSSFVCILGHDSEANTEPDVGADWQTYWRVMARGAVGPQGIPGEPGAPGEGGIPTDLNGVVVANGVSSPTAVAPTGPNQSLETDGSGNLVFGETSANAVTSPSDAWNNVSFTLDENGKENYGLRIIHPTAHMLAGGNQIRITLTGTNDYGAVDFFDVGFAQHAGSGNASGAFGSSLFKQVLFSGSQGITGVSSSGKASDWLDFDVNPSLDYMTILSLSGLNGNLRGDQSTSDGYYYKAAGASDNQTQNISGYTWAANKSRCVVKVEVRWKAKLAEWAAGSLWLKQLSVTPDAPLAGQTIIYSKTDGHVYKISSSGGETRLD